MQKSRHLESLAAGVALRACSSAAGFAQDDVSACLITKTGTTVLRQDAGGARRPMAQELGSRSALRRRVDGDHATQVRPVGLAASHRARTAS